MSSRTILVWFRNDLRIHDNEILVRALERGNKIVPVYCFDPRHFEITGFGSRKTGVIRASFIRQNLIDLKQTFKKFGGDLMIKQGEPEEILPGLCKQYEVDEVYHHREVAFEETQVSNLVEAALWKQQINLRHFIGHTLYHKEDLPFPIKDIPDSFSVFKKKVERETAVRPQLSPPVEMFFSEKLLTESTDLEIPNLQSLGFTDEEIALTDNSRFKGGEQTALTLMESFVNDPAHHNFDSLLSPYIATGALSTNTFYHTIHGSKKFQSDKKMFDLYLQKLLWRDYYRFMFKKHGNLYFKESGVTGTFPIAYTDDENAFKRWKEGRTGQPVIDEGMKALNETGFIDNQTRAILASYLVQNLKINWLQGAAWFEEKLIDYNPTNNYGNWAHIAGVGSSLKDNKSIDLSKILSVSEK